jgi:hypothetical protein
LKGRIRVDGGLAGEAEERLVDLGVGFVRRSAHAAVTETVDAHGRRRV